MNAQKFYLTTAIVYVNDTPGLHFLYEQIGADALARFHRQRGRDVFFLTGTDENASKIDQAARQRGEETRPFVDRLAELYRRAAGIYDVSYDRFIRTTDPDHVRGVQEFVRRWIANDDVYLAKYEGLYCVGCEAFYEETDLIDGRCQWHPDREIQHLSEENFFFRLSKYEEPLRKLYREHPEFCVPEFRRNEVLGWLDRGLKDISISRKNLKWGIPFPDHPEHTVYVWFDALINYVTGVGFGTDDALFKKWWPADLHVIGKDISRFHCIYWPAMLLAAGVPLPKQIHVHGFLEYRGQRLSKSQGNMIDPFAAAEEWGADATRYLVLREAGFERDAPVSPEIFSSRFNAELANGLGNTLQRTLALVERHCASSVPEPAAFGASEERVRDAALRAIAEHDEHAAALRFSEAIGAVVKLLGAVDRHYQETKPWELTKGNGDRPALTRSLYAGLESLRIAAALLWPYAPTIAARVSEQLGAPAPGSVPWAEVARWGVLRAGTPVRKGAPLFPRLEPARA